MYSDNFLSDKRTVFGKATIQDHLPDNARRIYGSTLPYVSLRQLMMHDDAMMALYCTSISVRTQRSAL